MHSPSYWYEQWNECAVLGVWCKAHVYIKVLTKRSMSHFPAMYKYWFKQEFIRLVKYIHNMSTVLSRASLYMYWCVIAQIRPHNNDVITVSNIQ